MVVGPIGSKKHSSKLPAKLVAQITDLERRIDEHLRTHPPTSAGFVAFPLEGSAYDLDPRVRVALESKYLRAGWENVFVFDDGDNYRYLQFYSSPR